MINTVIAGVSGRMGQALLEAIARDGQCRLHGALDRGGSAALGREVAPGVRVGDDIVAALNGASVLIDFTRPEASLRHLEACRAQGVALVLGTTGFDAAQKQTVAKTARTVPVMFAPNMSVGVNLLMKLAETAARTLAEGYDVEIIEAHHRHKIDAPSGTALGLGQAVAGALGRDLSRCAVYGREGVTGERPADTIGFATVRGGDIVGDHTVLFAGIGERVELTHKASSRLTFAQGALRAAKWLQGRPAGLYDMRDVLGLG